MFESEIRHNGKSYHVIADYYWAREGHKRFVELLKTQVFDLSLPDESSEIEPTDALLETIAEQIEWRYS